MSPRPLLERGRHTVGDGDRGQGSARQGGKVEGTCRGTWKTSCTSLSDAGRCLIHTEWMGG